jgi:hypothetical protein
MHHPTKPAQLTLHNGTEKITIRPRPAAGANPIHCRNWDLGAPEVRYTSVPNPGADGVTESPGFLGARQIILDLQILGDATGGHDAYWYAAQLTRMTHPSATPVLEINRIDDNTQGKSWFMQLRGNPYSITYGQRAAALLEMQLTFTCPGGFLESTPYSYATIDVIADDDLVTEWIFPAAFPKTFGMAGITYPQLNLDIGGDAAVSPVIYISGPCTNPEIVSETPAALPGAAPIIQRFKFTGLTLDTGETVGIDMGSGDIWLGAVDSRMIRDDMSAYNTVDWAVSTYWIWPPGPHTVIYLGNKGIVTVQYQERRFTI